MLQLLRTVIGTDQRSALLRQLGLVPSDQVLFIAGAVGTPTNSAIWQYMNEKKVPHQTDAGYKRGWPCQNAGAGRTSRTPFFSGHHVLASYGKPARKPGNRKNTIPLRRRPF
ncbi:MAG TPA: hypothetical protein VKE70_21165 [Candidatus Solibacter sp.]|nr:hypothetical protein [Candidatus Solibacter sp.]